MSGAGGTFDLAGPLPRGLTLLEASAGTGKTYTIAGLVARYVAGGYRLPQLLVVTFTRAATAELRERVRSRLVRTADHLDRVLAGGDPAGNDPVESVLGRGDAATVRDRRDRLHGALAEFDAATISTIHGFCQHVLHGVGLAGDVDREAALIEDQRDLIDEVVDDLYLRTFHGAPEVEVSRWHLRAIADKVVSNHDATIVPRAPVDPVAALRCRLADQARDTVQARKLAAGLLSYDDLLTRLRDALRDRRRGDAVRARLRDQYRLALIDEFQDTDPVQWEILERTFGDGADTDGEGDRGGSGDGPATLVLIGDPKQAIYTFRGADVYAYLDAAGTAPRRTLGVNWRSDAPLLRAFDALLDGATLGHDDIRYRHVEHTPAHREPRLVGSQVGTPLRLRVVRRDHGLRMMDGRNLYVDAAQEHVARDLAAEAVWLLHSDAQLIERDEDGRERRRGPVLPEHLAVLVRRNVEATLIQRVLHEAGVPAVINGVGSVFATAAATDWLRLLEALERPADPTRARAAALTAFVGWSAHDVAEASDERWEDLHVQLHRWAAVLRDRSVASLVRTITLDEQLPARLLACRGGERLLTDIGHIGELLHGVVTDEELGVTSLAGWVRERIRESDDLYGPEDQARRLESDAEAVQVLTVHRSKGLEFPIVYAPYLWSPGWTDLVVPLFHDPDLGPGRILDVGGRTSDGFQEHKNQAEREQQGEDLRLLYVALTRAQHQTVVWWAPARNAEGSPLSRVLFCRSEDGQVNTRCSKGYHADDDAVLERLGALASRSSGTITVERVPAEPARTAWAGRDVSAPALTAAAFRRDLDRRWQRTSYSALTALPIEPAVGSEPDEAVVADEALPVTALDAIGTAAGADADEGGAAAEEERARRVPSPLGAVPGGAAIGTFVHAVLEETDFTALDIMEELVRRVGEQADRHPRTHIGEHAVLVDGLARVLDTPLGPLVGDVSLRQVGRGDRVDELGFELPLVGGNDPTAEVTVAAIGRVLRRHLPAHDPLARYPDHLRDAAFRRHVRGFLAGSIDLVLRVRGGSAGAGIGAHDASQDRFVVIDHKTNRLAPPDEELTAWHYRPAALAEAMAHGHYPLQALLYTVALHRYLRWRLPGYDPARNLGGALYLFVRGMTGADVPRVGGQPCGVFSWAPRPDLVVALSDLLDRGGTDAEEAA